MKCKKCGFEDPNPIFEPLFPKLSDSCVKPSFEAMKPVTQILALWACGNCARYHNQDGSLYEPEKQKSKPPIYSMIVAGGQSSGIYKQNEDGSLELIDQ